MRKVIGTAGIMAAGIGLVFSMAAAAAPDEQTPETGAYLSFGFGGGQPGARALHYGLRLDHDRYFVPEGQTVPPLMQLDFSRRGLSAMQVNGLNVLRPAYRVNQAEEGAEEVVAEEEGFFESIGNWFSDLFGEDEEEGEIAGESPGEAAPEEAEAEVAEEGGGTFLGYGVVDWGLLAVGVAGIGFITSEVADGDDDPNPKLDSDGDGIPDDEEPPSGTPCTITTPVPLPPGCTPFAGRQAGVAHSNTDPEYQEWLDSGTGQMGDLQYRD